MTTKEQGAEGIMREFDDNFKDGKFMPKENETMISLEAVVNFFSEAYTRHRDADIVRVFDELIMCMPVSAKEERETIYLHMQKFSPKPRYCAGMQEAIDKSDINIKAGKYMLVMGYNGISYETEREIHRCPFCKEGNCIAEAADG